MPNQSNGLKHPFIEVIMKPINHLKVIIAPDGGLARIRIYGTDCDMHKRIKLCNDKKIISNERDWEEVSQNCNFLTFVNTSPMY
jgi:allantoicase